MADKEKTVIKLKDDDVALVMNSNGDVALYFPERGDKNNVPVYVQFMSALATVCTSDEEVIELIWERFHKLVDKVN